MMDDVRGKREEVRGKMEEEGQVVVACLSSYNLFLVILFLMRLISFGTSLYRG